MPKEIVSKSRCVKEKTPYYYRNEPAIIEKKQDHVEYKMQCALAQYIDTTYPNADWTSLMMGTNVGKINGAMNKRKGCKRHWHDMLFDNANGGHYGARVELKAFGRLPDEGQLEEIERKWKNGYFSTWTDDIRVAIDIIDWYYSLEPTKKRQSNIAPEVYNMKERFSDKKRCKRLQKLKEKFEDGESLNTILNTSLAIRNGDDLIILD